MNAGRPLLFILVVLFNVFCLKAQESERVNQEVIRLLEAQSSAWNDGNIDAFMKTYWPDENLQFLSKEGPTFGYRNTLENYYRRYPDRQAMGHLTFEMISLNRRSRKVYSLIGKYHLERQALENLEGYFLLILQKIKGQWKIVADSTH